MVEGCDGSDPPQLKGCVTVVELEMSQCLDWLEQTREANDRGPVAEQGTGDYLAFTCMTADYTRDPGTVPAAETGLKLLTRSAESMVISVAR